MLLDFLKDDIVIISSNDIKDKIINYCVENSLFFNIKYMSLNELTNRLTFDINEEMIVKVMDKFKFNYDVTKMYLNNMKFLLDEDSNDKRITLLKEIKRFCDEESLIEYNSVFLKLISKKELFIVGYDYINKFQRKILDINNINYKIIELRKSKKTTNIVYEFKTMEDEIHFVANNILSLVEKGIDINKIFLANVDEKYNYLISRIFKMYNLPYSEKKSVSLYETIVGKYFIDNLNEDISLTLEMVKTKFKEASDTLNLIVDVLNKYCFIDNFIDYKDILINEFKNIKLDTKKYKNSVREINLRDNIILDDEYIFLLGFNLSVIPKIYKNEDYFSDEIKFSYMESTSEKNKLEKNIYKNIIRSIKNLIITYKLTYLNESFYPSILIEELDLSIQKKEREISKFSDIANKILLVENLDEYFKFGTIKSTLNDLLFNYKNINYNTYDNKFKSINNFNNDIVLSYSSMNNYYKCAFRYYLANVLKIDIYNENFSQYIGNLFHYVLQHYYGEEKDVFKHYNDFIINNKYDFSEKEKYFLEVLKDEISFIINRINRQNELSTYNEVLYEEKFEINFENDVFKGFIDKILFKDDKIVIIDYKTGSIDIDLSLIPYGLSLQLPVYLYLAKKNKNAKIVGFYLQHILNNKMRKVSSKSYESLKNDSLKLQGYSIGNEAMLSEFDESVRDSEVIKGMKIGKNGFYHYSKVLTEKEIEKIVEIVDTKINEAFHNIKNANFVINPKIANNKELGCEFCKFKDICFKTEKDKVYLNIDTECSFLGGDNNA